MAVDTHVESAQADAAAAAVPDEVARMAEGVGAQAEPPRVYEEAPWRTQGARRPLRENADVAMKYLEGAIQLQGTTASVQEMWRKIRWCRCGRRG